jgi:rhodanese-related sulfurtransferase
MRFLCALALAWLLAGALALLPTQEIPAQGDELLLNGGFEDEDSTDPWKSFFGELTTLAGGGRNGSAAGVFVAEGPTPLHWVSQCVPAWEGGEYEFVGYLAGPSKVSVRATTVWYSLDGCLGDQLLLPPDLLDWRELEMLPLEDRGPWYYLEAEPFPGELGSRSARVNLLFDFIEAGEGIIYLDDFSLRGPPAPSPTPTPTATSLPTSTPTALATPTPTLAPTVTASPAPSPHSTPRPTVTVTRPRPTAAPSPRAGGGQRSSPQTTFGLVNGGFEETDGDGGLLGWRKYGGELARSADASQEGSFSAAFRSWTESTKWVFQTVRVEGGKAYELSGYALKNDPNVEAAYFRLSWYTSVDGTGQAIGTVDSTSRLTEDSPDFRFLATGAVVAPAEASSAKVRLMLDPASETEAIVYFDAISFVETEVTAASPQETPPPTAVLGDESPPTVTPVPGGESPPSPSVSSETPASLAQPDKEATPAPFGSPSPSSPSMTPGVGSTPSGTADGEGTSTDGGGEVLADGRDAGGEVDQTPATLYRQRRGSGSLQVARRETAGSDGDAIWPVVPWLTGLAVALGLGCGVYLWWWRSKRTRPP